MTIIYSSLLKERSFYLNRLAEDYEAYGPNVRSCVKGYLPHNPVMQLYLNNVLESLYDHLQAANENEVSEGNALYRLFSSVQTQIREYIHVKKEASDEISKLVSTDMWTHQFTSAKDQKEAQSLLETSDKFEDFLFLAKLTLKNKLSEEDSHLGDVIDNTMSQFPAFLLMVPPKSKLQAKIKRCLDKLKSCYTAKKYTQAEKQIEKINTLIKF